MHRPQRMQAVGSGRTASASVMARTAFVFFKNRLVEIRHGDAHHRAAVKHLLRLRAEAAGLLKHICKLHPNGDDHVLGFATAEPSTVMHFSTSGIPVLQ